MTNEASNLGSEHLGPYRPLLAELFPEIALVSLPEELREGLQALSQIAGMGIALLVPRLSERHAVEAQLERQLEALGRDLITLSRWATVAATSGEGDSPALRAVASDIADRLRTLAGHLRTAMEEAR